MKTCKDCKWWDMEVVDQGGIDSGDCKNVFVSERVASIPYSASIVFYADFGCIYWEEHSTSKNQEREKLVGIVFDIGLSIHKHQDFFKNKRPEEVTAWIRTQLAYYGFFFNEAGELLEEETDE